MTTRGASRWPGFSNTFEVSGTRAEGMHYPIALREDVDVPLSPAVGNLLRRAVLLADQLGMDYVEPRLLLAALLEDESQGVAILLREAGVDRARILESLKKPPAP